MDLPVEAKPDRDLCVCFHVPRQKIIKFIRNNKPRYASQVAECYGAGTGCGYCVPFIREIHEAMLHGTEIPDDGLSLEEYLARRKEYHRKKKITDTGKIIPELVDPQDDTTRNLSCEPPPVKSLTTDMELKDAFGEADDLERQMNEEPS